MKLYVLPGACSFVPHTALEWAKADYELEIMNHDTIKSAEYLRINPQGSVPAIVDNETVVTQNIAVQTYIDALYPNANIFGLKDLEDDNKPAAKAKIMHWLAFLNADVHKGFAPLFGPNKFIKEESAHKELQQNAKHKIVDMLSIANEQLGKHDYLTGTKSTADLYLYVILRWGKKFELDLSDCHHFNGFIDRIENDIGVTTALSQEGLEKIKSL